MKKIFLILAVFLGFMISVYPQSLDTLQINEVTVVSFYRNAIDAGTVIEEDKLIEENYGQEPSHLFSKMPSIYAYTDSGTDFGYGYFRIRGLDQTRVNVTLDGCPWNEAEDFGTYFANSPDIMSSLNSIKIERGGSSTNNGIAGSAGGINMETIDLYRDNLSYAYLGGGNYGRVKASLVYNMPTDGKWGLHIKATHQQTDGFKYNSFNKSEALTVKFGYKFNQNHSIDFLTMNGFHRNGQGWIGATLEEIELDNRINGCTPAEDDNWLMSMNRVQYKGILSDNIVLTSSLYGQFQTGGYRMDLDNYNKRIIDPNSPITEKIYDYGLNHYMVGGNTFAKFYLRKVILTTGFNAYTYRRNHYMDDRCQNIPIEEYYSNFGRKTEFSYLVNAVYKPVKNLSIGANVQYRGVFFRYRDTEKYGNPYGNTSVERNWNFINFGANIEYRLVSDLAVYARFTYLNREPTRSDMFGGNEYYMGELVTTVPEISKDLEFGVDYSWEKVKANINFFYIWFDNELILNGEYGPNGLPIHENAKSSYRRGIEASLDWNIVDNLYYTFNGSLSQNRVNSASFGDKNHIMSPASNLFTEVSWRDESWEAGANLTYRDKMYVDMENKYTIPYLLNLGLYAKIKWENIEVSASLMGIRFYDRLDYCNGMVGANGNLLLLQNAPLSLICGVRYSF